MKATISLKNNVYVLDIGETQVILGGQGGLSPENIQEMLDALYKIGEPPELKGSV